MDILLKNLVYLWLLVPVLMIVFYSTVLQMLGIIIVPEDKIGLVTKKFVLFGEKMSLPEGKIIAMKGEPGYQAKTLAAGIYYCLWPWQYDVKLQDFTVIPSGKVGLISAKDGITLPINRLLGSSVECDSYQDAEKFLTNNGFKGRQVRMLVNGTYKINTHLFDVAIADLTQIPADNVGIVITNDGAPLPLGEIAGKPIEGHNNFQDFDKFVELGGSKGLQPQVLQSGTYALNPWAVKLEVVQMTVISIGHVGVVVSYVGDEGVDVTGEEFKHGNLVAKGQKGVQYDILEPGKYAVNPKTTKVVEIPTTNIVLNWADSRTESHNLDQNLSTITVRSQDGFSFNLDVSQIIHIPMKDAPKVVARFGDMNNLVSQVLEPTIGNYFRNSAQAQDVISFLNNRSERQAEAKKYIDTVLKEYDVKGVDSLIGDIVPPEAIMKTLSERKIAAEQVITYGAQKKSEEVRQQLEKEKAIADMQPEVVKATQNVEISERSANAEIKRTEGVAKSIELKANAEAAATKMTADAEAHRIKVTGDAESSKILSIGKSTAEAYNLQVKAMGSDNFAKFKITESIGQNKIEIMPKILIGGNENGGPMNGLLAMKLMESMDVASVTADKKE